MASGPNSRVVRLKRSPISPKASSQLIGLNFPSPFGPVRFKGPLKNGAYFRTPKGFGTLRDYLREDGLGEMR
jgi:hypothetical protein